MENEIIQEKSLDIHIQNISKLSIGIFSLLACLYYSSQKASGILVDTSSFDYYLMPIIGIHATIDLFMTKKLDIKIHHLCIFGFSSYIYYYQVPPEVRILFCYPMIKTEISTIFLALKEYIPKNSVWHSINLILFYVSFFKLRVLDYYSDILHKHDLLNFIIRGYSSGNLLLSAILVTSCYCLYILNIYWFFILNKILYKILTKVFSGMNIDQTSRWLCPYIHILNIPLTVYIYFQQPNEKYLFYVICITSLSATSLIYQCNYQQGLSKYQAHCQ